jgi:hypothetical protein
LTQPNLADGYELLDNTRSSRGLFGMFYSGDSHPLAISKNGAVFEAADGNGQLNWYSPRLIGWLVPAPER